MVMLEEDYLKVMELMKKSKKIMFKNFKFLTEDKITEKEIQKLKKMDVQQIPILNKKKTF